MTYNELGVVLEAASRCPNSTCFDYGKCGVSQLEDGLYARADYLAKNRDTTVRFLRASIRGWQDVLKDPDRRGQDRVRLRHLRRDEAWPTRSTWPRKWSS